MAHVTLDTLDFSIIVQTGYLHKTRRNNNHEIDGPESMIKMPRIVLWCVIQTKATNNSSSAG